MYVAPLPKMRKEASSCPLVLGAVAARLCIGKLYPDFRSFPIGNNNFLYTVYVPVFRSLRSDLRRSQVDQTLRWKSLPDYERTLHPFDHLILRVASARNLTPVFFLILFHYIPGQ